jgi:hypothetical protein
VGVAIIGRETYIDPDSLVLVSLAGSLELGFGFQLSSN